MSSHAVARVTRPKSGLILFWNRQLGFQRLQFTRAVLIKEPFQVRSKLAQNGGRSIRTQRPRESADGVIQSSIMLRIIGVLQGAGGESTQHFRGIELASTVIAPGYQNARRRVP